MMPEPNGKYLKCGKWQNLRCLNNLADGRERTSPERSNNSSIMVKIDGLLLQALSDSS
jgi:hypothetical protein